MTKQQLLLVVLMEEASEVQKAAAKALRFGLDDAHQGQTNREMLEYEIADLCAVIELLHSGGAISDLSVDMVKAKQVKIEKWMEYSKTKNILK